jgi:hypothetical protein
MGTENHNVVSFKGNTLAKGTHGVIVAIYCTKKGTTGAKLEIINGLLATDPVEFEVYGEDIQSVFNINRRLENGIFLKITAGGGGSASDAEWIAVFK